MILEFVGAGDAFGSGGRLQACLSVRWAGHHVLVDCGATSLVGLKRLGLEPAGVEAVLVSHLHGDHFGGLPFLILDQQFARRERPLIVGGPIGTAARLEQALEVLFPGSSRIQRRFRVDVVEQQPHVATDVGPARVTTVSVDHASGAPALGYESSVVHARSPTRATRPGRPFCSTWLPRPTSSSARRMRSIGRSATTWTTPRSVPIAHSCAAGGWC